MQPCWSYTGPNGCQHWGDIGYKEAAVGQEQSPININTDSCECQTSGSPAFKVTESVSIEGKIKNTGFTPKVLLSEKSEHIEVDGEKFGLVQFHFHSPTEHSIDNVYYPLELHLVHESMTTPGKLAVVAVLFEVGAESLFMNRILPIIPQGANKAVNLINPLSLEGLSLQPKYWNYKGSLTTPPCTEGVKWVVLKETHTLSRDQLSSYLKLFPLETNRPVQPLNNRVVTSTN